MNNKRTYFRVVSLCLLMTSIFVISSCGKKKVKAPMVPEVQVIKVLQTNVPVTADFVGQTYGYKDIPIRARVEGFLTGLYFTEGSYVKTGQLLYTIDPDPYKAIEAEKQSGVAEAVTMLAKAESDLNRIRPLAEMNAVSQSDLDAAVAQYGASKASVDAAEAALRYSQINVGYATMYSPINGIIGKTEAKVGEFVGRPPNPIVLNTVSRIDTILVQFSITESDYLALIREVEKRKAAGEFNKDSVGTQKMRLILADGSIHKYPGRFNFANRQIDPTTGTMLLQTSFPNPEGLLRPGQFARVRAVVAEIPDGIVIPQRCVREFQGVFQVFVVNDSNKIEVRQVKMGPKVGSMWVVMAGLKPADRIVFEGLMLVRQGIKVKPQEVPIPEQFMNFKEQ